MKGIHLEYAQQPVDAQVHVPHARVRVGLWVGGPHRQPEVTPELEADVDDVGGDRTVEQQRTVGIEELSRDGKWLRELKSAQTQVYISLLLEIEDQTGQNLQ